MNKKQNPTLTIAKRELGAYFTNPAAYIVTAIFLIASGVFFFSIFAFFINKRADLRYFFLILPYAFSVFIPALTMRLFSEEFRSGSFETLMTLPVTPTQVVLGKFLAAFITSAAMLLPTLFYVVTAYIFGNPDFGPIIGGYIGALFLCAVYSAIGVFSSVLTKNQIIAFFCALAISIALTLLGTLLIFLPTPLVRFFSWLSITTHFQAISRGIADTRDVIYFATITIIFLLLTQQKFVVKKVRADKIDIAIFAVILILANLVGGRAFLRADLTNDKIYSISKASKEVVKNLQEPFTVNVFFSSDLPAPYNSVDQYIRDILVEYKAAANENFNYKIFDMDKKENEDIARSYGINQIQVQKVETTEVSAKAVWMGIALVHGDNIKIFDALDSTVGLEYKLTTAISKMISTNDALASLRDDLNIILYSASDLIEYNVLGLDELPKIIEETVAELNKKFGGKIKLNVMNATESDAEKVAAKYGIQPIPYKNDNDSKEHKTSLGIVAELGEKFIPIQLKIENFFGLRLFGLENIDSSLEAAIKTLVSKTVEIGYITGHSENTLYTNPYGDPSIPSSENFRNALNDIYTLKSLNLAEEEIPLNIKCIIINGSKTEFSQSELYKIDQFVMKGGSILFCLDPLIELPESGPNAPPSYVSPRTGLPKLLNAYGIKPGENYVMDTVCYESNQGRGQTVQLNWAPLVMKKQLNDKNPITKYITGMIFLQNGSIDISDAIANPDLTATVLARSSEQSWTVSQNIILYPGYIFPPSDESLYGEKNLAVLIEGKFTSAFANEEIPGDKPQGELEAQGAASAPLSLQEKISKGIQNAKIIFVNSSQATTGQLIDQNFNEPMAYFMRNAVDYLNGAEEFCEMRTKGINQNLLEIKNQASATAFKFFNQFGLAALVALIGLFVWRARSVRRNEIRLRYNPETVTGENND